MVTNSHAATADPELHGLLEAARARVRGRLARRDSFVSYLGAAAFLAAAFALASTTNELSAASLPLLVILTAAYACASRVEFEVGLGCAIPTQLVFVPMLFLLPPSLVPLCVAAGLLAGSASDLRPSPVERSAVTLVSAWHAIGPALVLVLAGSPEATSAAPAILVLALAAQFAFDFGACAGRAAALGVPLRTQVRIMVSVYLVDACLAPVGFAVAVAAAGQPYAFVLALPLVGLLGYFARERRGRIDHALELGSAYRGTALLLGDVIEADHEYTGSHSRDVVELVLGVADELGLDARERRDAEFAALLHDVGKIRIPQAIIDKPGALTPEERAIIETHTVAGEEMLDKVGGVLGGVGRIVRSCHERWDGAGYPDRLAGEEIPLVARIVCACDAFSAMTTDRPYRAARTAPEALEEMRSCAGTHFDPRVVDALDRVLAR